MYFNLSHPSNICVKSASSLSILHFDISNNSNDEQLRKQLLKFDANEVFHSDKCSECNDLQPKKHDDRFVTLCVFQLQTFK